MISAIITAAGNGTRFGRNKMIAELDGETVLIKTVRQFSLSKFIDEIVVCAKKHDFGIYRELLKNAGLTAKLVEGGEERVVSAYNGVLKSKGEFVVVHDGVRPFVPVLIIDKICEEVKKYKAVMTAVPPTATIKYARDFLIEKSFPRAVTWVAQTPQAFAKEIILKAYKTAIDNKYLVATDDSELVMNIGEKVKIVEGDPVNVKITFPVDLIMAQGLMRFIEEGNRV